MSTHNQHQAGPRVIDERLDLFHGQAEFVGGKQTRKDLAFTVLIAVWDHLPVVAGSGLMLFTQKVIVSQHVKVWSPEKDPERKDKWRAPMLEYYAKIHDETGHWVGTKWNELLPGVTRLPEI